MPSSRHLRSVGGLTCMRSAEASRSRTFCHSRSHPGDADPVTSTRHPLNRTRATVKDVSVLWRRSRLQHPVEELWTPNMASKEMFQGSGQEVHANCLFQMPKSSLGFQGPSRSFDCSVVPRPIFAPCGRGCKVTPAEKKCHWYGNSQPDSASPRLLSDLLPMCISSNKCGPVFGHQVKAWMLVSFLLE